MPVHDPRYWPDDKPHVRAGYLDAMAGFVERLLAEGHRVELYGTQPADEWVAEELIERIAPAGARDGLSLARIRTLDQLARFYHRCDIIAATRFHGILLALRFVRPVVGICYYRKSRELLRDFGIERYAFDLDRVTADQLRDAFSAIAAERPAVERLLRRRLASRADDLFEQYRQVLSVSTAEAVQV
jgi:polysaccharide pyruvyl transferase WcaK-like protein